MYFRVVYFLIVNFLHRILPAALLASGNDSTERRKTSIHTTDNELLDGPGYEVEEPMQEAIEGETQTSSDTPHPLSHCLLFTNTPMFSTLNHTSTDTRSLASGS